MEESSPSEPADSPSPSTAKPSERPVPDLYVNNGLAREVVVSLEVMEGRGRYREDRNGSHTVTEPASPTETPNVVFSDTTTIPPDVGENYVDIADEFESEYHRLEVSVANGPNATDLVPLPAWGTVTVSIGENTIRFGRSTP